MLKPLTPVTQVPRFTAAASREGGCSDLSLAVTTQSIPTARASLESSRDWRIVRESNPRCLHGKQTCCLYTNDPSRRRVLIGPFAGWNLPASAGLAPLILSGLVARLTRTPRLTDSCSIPLALDLVPSKFAVLLALLGLALCHDFGSPPWFNLGHGQPP